MKTIFFQIFFQAILAILVVILKRTWDTGLIFLSIYTPPQHALTRCCFFLFRFYLLFSLSLTLIIGIFYCLNYTSLLLHLITTHLVSHLCLSSIIFIISTIIMSIFYCLNFASLSLHPVITHRGMS